MPEDKFVHGVVVALDVVAIYDQAVLFKEIVEAAGRERVLREIKINGLQRTKNMANEVFN